MVSRGIQSEEQDPPYDNKFVALGSLSRLVRKSIMLKIMLAVTKLFTEPLMLLDSVVHARYGS